MFTLLITNAIGRALPQILSAVASRNQAPKIDPVRAVNRVHSDANSSYASKSIVGNFLTRGPKSDAIIGAVLDRAASDWNSRALTANQDEVVLPATQIQTTLSQAEKEAVLAEQPRTPSEAALTRTVVGKAITQSQVEAISQQSRNLIGLGARSAFDARLALAV